MFMMYFDGFYFTELELIYNETFKSKAFCCADGWRGMPKTFFHPLLFTIIEEDRKGV